MSNPRGRPKKQDLLVSPEQKIALRQLLQQPRSSRSLAFRARIILECASGQNNAAVAIKLRTTSITVGMWRNRFITGGLAALGEGGAGSSGTADRVAWAGISRNAQLRRHLRPEPLL